MKPSLLGLSKKSGLLACAILCGLSAPIRAQEAATVLAKLNITYGELAVSPEAGLVAQALGDTITLHSLKTGKPVGKTTFPNRLQTGSPTFSKDGKTLAWLNADGLIVLRDLASGKDQTVRYREPWSQKNEPDGLTLSPDTKMAAINRYGRSVHFVDLAADRLIPGERIVEAKDPIIFSPDGKTVFLNHTSSSQRLEVFETATNKHLHTLRPYAETRHCALSPDGKTLAITEPMLDHSTETMLRKHIVLWDPIEDKEKARFRMAAPLEPGRMFGPLAFSPDGKTIAYCYEQRERSGNLSKPYIGFIDAATGKPVAAMLAPEYTPWYLMYMPDGASIVVGYGQKVNVYRVPGGKAAAKEAGPAADLLVKGSVWVNDSPSQVFTILERKGEMFRARFVHSFFDREVTGTIKDGKISWLAKDVRASRGDKGGDNEGTIFADGSIDFVYKERSGSTGKYTLKLKKGR